MNTKQRDVILQRWSGAIRRETRDIPSLENTGARALADPDVRDDATLQSLIRADIQQRRNQLEQELQTAKSSPAHSATRPKVRAAPPVPITTPSADEIREAFNRLVLALCASLERSDEGETDAIFEKMRAYQQQNSEILPAAAIAEYKQRVAALRTHQKNLIAEITTLSQQAVAASKAGIEPDLSRATRRLTAIHAAHPLLLSERRLEQIRAEIIAASDERRQNRVTTRRLLERQRGITDEIKKLAFAVHEFHDVACTTPETSVKFHEAEAQYLRTVREVRAHDTEWFAGVVLELADLLAEWTLPPVGAEKQIDRFLDSISLSLKSIRGEMHKIESHQGSDDDASASETI